MYKRKREKDQFPTPILYFPRVAIIPDYFLSIAPTAPFESKDRW